jgi:hypothetical protein
MSSITGETIQKGNMARQQAMVALCRGFDEIAGKRVRDALWDIDRDTAQRMSRYVYHLSALKQIC